MSDLPEDPFANIPFATAVRAPHRTSAVRLRTLSCAYRPILLVHLLLRCSYQALRSNGMHLTGSLHLTQHGKATMQKPVSPAGGTGRVVSSFDGAIR